MSDSSMPKSLVPRNQLAKKRNWQECDRSGSLKRDMHQGTNTPSARAKVPSVAASAAFQGKRAEDDGFSQPMPKTLETKNVLLSEISLTFPGEAL